MKGYKIHIIDDDPATYDILNEYLESAGFKVKTAVNGRAGLTLMHNDPPDLVLLDIQMPEMNGFQVLEAMSKQKSLQDTPVLFITSLNRTNLKIKGLELGADDFIVKPFERAELFARIKASLRRSNRYRQTENVFTGNLTDISINELLQTLDIGKKIARISFPKMNGVIFVDRGVLVHSSQNQFIDEAALIRLFLMDKGNFSVDFGVTTTHKSNSILSIQHQMLNCFVYIDRLEKRLAELAEVNPTINILPLSLVIENRSSIEKLLPLPLNELLILLPGDIIANIEHLV